MNITISKTLTITDQHCADILCTALEGGIGYWAQARNIKRKLAPALSDNDLEDYVECEIAELNDDESDYDWSKPLTLNYLVIIQGISRIVTNANDQYTHLADGVFNDIHEDDVGQFIDADVADVIVQVGLFNEIRYG